DEKVLAAEAAGPSARNAAKRPCDANAVAELQAFVLREVLLHDEVLGNVPPARRARQNELAFELVRALAAQLRDRLELDGTAADDLLLDPARLTDALVLEIEDWIDGVLALERTESMLPTPSGEPRSVARRRHSLEIQLGGPPPGEPVLDFQPGCV